MDSLARKTCLTNLNRTFYFSALCKTPLHETDKTTSPSTEDKRGFSLPPYRKFSGTSEASLSSTPPTLVNSPGTPSSLAVSSSGSSYPPPLATESSRILIPPPSAQDPSSMRFALPSEAQEKADKANSPEASPTGNRSDSDIVTPKGIPPSLFSILVISFLPFSRLAIESHIRTILPKTIPHLITVVKDFDECKALLSTTDQATFTHLVINLPDYTEIAALTEIVQRNPKHSQTTLVILTTPIHRTAIIETNPTLYNQLGGRVQFIYKPIKPSRLSVIFDPAQERDASRDRYRHSAQQVVQSQKAVFSRMEREVGNKGHKVLLVEDNLVNQKVLLRFLGRVGLEVETATDGEECVKKVLDKPPGYYGLILVGIIYSIISQL